MSQKTSWHFFEPCIKELDLVFWKVLLSFQLGACIGRLNSVADFFSFNPSVFMACDSCLPLCTEQVHNNNKALPLIYTLF